MVERAKRLNEWGYRESIFILETIFSMAFRHLTYKVEHLSW